MEKTIISTSNSPVGPYSTAIKVGNTLYCSGQIALGHLDKDVAQQTAVICSNILDILDAAQMHSKDIVKTTCFLSDMALFDAFNAEYAKFFTHKPARSCVAVKDLPKGAIVEIEFIAIKAE